VTKMNEIRKRRRSTCFFYRASAASRAVSKTEGELSQTERRQRRRIKLYDQERMMINGECPCDDFHPAATAKLIASVETLLVREGTVLSHGKMAR